MLITGSSTDPARCMFRTVLPRSQHHRRSGRKQAGQPHLRAVISWNDHCRHRRCQIACNASSVSTQSRAAGSQQGNGAVAEAILVAIVPAGDTGPLGPGWQVISSLVLVLDLLPLRGA